MEVHLQILGIGAWLALAAALADDRRALDPSEVEGVYRYRSDSGGVLSVVFLRHSRYFFAAGGHLFETSNGSSYAIGVQEFEDPKFGKSCFDPGWDGKAVTFYCGGCKRGDEKPDLDSSTRQARYTLEPEGQGRVSDGRYVSDSYEWAHYDARDGQREAFVLRSEGALERLRASKDYRPGVRAMTETEYAAEFDRLNNGALVRSTARAVQGWSVVRSRETQSSERGEVRDWFEVPKSVVARYSNVDSRLSSVEYVVTWDWATRTQKLYRIIRRTDAKPAIAEVPFTEGILARGDSRAGPKANTLAIDDPAYLGKGAEIRIPTPDERMRSHRQTTLHYGRKFPHLWGGSLPDRLDLLKDPERAGEMRALIHRLDPRIRFAEDIGRTAASLCDAVLASSPAPGTGEGATARPAGR